MPVWDQWKADLRQFLSNPYVNLVHGQRRVLAMRPAQASGRPAAGVEPRCQGWACSARCPPFQQSRSRAGPGTSLKACSVRSCTPPMASKTVSGSAAPALAHAPADTRLHAAAAEVAGPLAPPTTMACVALMRDTVEGMLEGTREAQRAGADLVELRLDALRAFDPSNDIPRLINESALPMIITLRPTWEGCVRSCVWASG